jgi:hypothetical protein
MYLAADYRGSIMRFQVKSECIVSWGNLVNAQTAEVDFGAGNFSGKANQAQFGNS